MYFLWLWNGVKCSDEDGQQDSSHSTQSVKTSHTDTGTQAQGVKRAENRADSRGGWLDSSLILEMVVVLGVLGIT